MKNKLSISLTIKKYVKFNPPETTLRWPRLRCTRCCDKVGSPSASPPPAPDRDCPPPHSSGPWCTAPSSSSILTWRTLAMMIEWHMAQNLAGRVKNSLVCRQSSPCWHKRDETELEAQNQLSSFTFYVLFYWLCSRCFQPFYRLSLSVSTHCSYLYSGPHIQTWRTQTRDSWSRKSTARAHTWPLINQIN